MGFGEIRPKPQCLVETGQAFIQSALANQRAAKVAARFSEIRLQLEGHEALLGRCGVLARSKKSQTHVVVGLPHTSATIAVCLRGSRQCFLKSSQPCEGKAEIVAGAGIIRLQAQGLLVASHGLGVGAAVV